MAVDLKKISQEEMELFIRLKPLIGECLKLNHNLNNPLAGVVGYSELLLSGDEELSENQKNMVNKIMGSAIKMQELLEDLCDKKINAGNVIDREEIARVFGTL